MIIKPLGVSSICNTSTSNSYSNANLVRLSHYDNPNTAHTVYCYYANGSLKYTCPIIGGESIILEKSPTDTINSSSTDVSLRIVPVAYKA
jgi:hypothetical protein